MMHATLAANPIDFGRGRLTISPIGIVDADKVRMGQNQSTLPNNDRAHLAGWGCNKTPKRRVTLRCAMIETSNSAQARPEMTNFSNWQEARLNPAHWRGSRLRGPLVAMPKRHFAAEVDQSDTCPVSYRHAASVSFRTPAVIA